MWHFILLLLMLHHIYNVVYGRCLVDKCLYVFVALAWHPVHECLFTSGGSDGAIMYWLAK